jgi:solute carrier family 25 (mitochondrial phosphate transporter), member 23/24/25/41
MLKQVKVPEYQGLSVWQSFRFMWQREGFKGFLKGNGVNVVRIAPFSAFEMFFYDFYKQHLFGGQSATPMTKLLCGGLTGMTASSLTYPLDLIRTVLSIRVEGAEGKPPSMGACAKKIVARDGFRGLYKGMGATLLVSLA